MSTYTIKSISNDGEWYLVKGWRKYKSHWQNRDNCLPDTTFKSVASAMRSLTKLLKVMPEYLTDTFYVVKITYNEEYCCYDVEEIHAWD